MSGSAVAIALAASANSAAMSARAAAERAECRQMVSAIDPRSASVDVMRAYAHCVYVIYGDGEPISSSAQIMLKAFLLLIIFSAFGGAFLGYRLEKDAMGAVLGFLVFPASVCLGVMICAGLFYAVKFIVEL